MNSVEEIKKINVEKMISDFLAVIDFKLCGISQDEITIQDELNKDELNRVLNLPIDFKSNDDLRIFRCSALTKDEYDINVLNTKYVKNRFLKNSIDSFKISLKKRNFSNSSDELFSSEISYDDNLYIIFIGKNLEENYFSCRKCSKEEFIDVIYSLDNGVRKLEICVKNLKTPGPFKKIYIMETSDNNQRDILVVEEKNKEVYKQEITGEIEEYFKALVYRVGFVINQANDGLRTLSNNVYEGIFNYYGVTAELLELVNNSSSTCSIQLIDELLKKYFSDSELYSNIINTDAKMTQQKRLTLNNLTKIGVNGKKFYS